MKYCYMPSGWRKNNSPATGEESGTKPVEHVIGFDELDLQRTVDVNTQRGFGFVLRSEPTK
jgi:hypothetical protein